MYLHIYICANHYVQTHVATHSTILYSVTVYLNIYLYIHTHIYIYIFKYRKTFHPFLSVRVGCVIVERQKNIQIYTDMHPLSSNHGSERGFPGKWVQRVMALLHVCWSEWGQHISLQTSSFDTISGLRVTNGASSPSQNSTWEEISHTCRYSIYCPDMYLYECCTYLIIFVL